MSAAGRSEWLGPRARPAGPGRPFPRARARACWGTRARVRRPGPQGSPYPGLQTCGRSEAGGATDLRDPELELRGSSRSRDKPSKVCELCSHRRSGPAFTPVTTVKITSPPTCGSRRKTFPVSAPPPPQVVLILNFADQNPPPHLHLRFVETPCREASPRLPMLYICQGGELGVSNKFPGDAEAVAKIKRVNKVRGVVGNLQSSR